MLWTVTGILVLVFACGKRYQGNADQLNAEGAATNQVPGAAPVAGTSTTTITNRPDGFVEKKTEVTNPDGSKTVTVVIENPMEDV
jgi:hypothetical protein